MFKSPVTTVQTGNNQISINSRMDEDSVAYSYKGILYSDVNEDTMVNKRRQT